MAQTEPNSWNRRVASVVKRSYGDDFPLESVRVIEVKDLFGNFMSSKSSAPGWLESGIFLTPDSIGDNVRIAFLYCYLIAIR